jgi:hypothetical protein
MYSIGQIIMSGIAAICLCAAAGAVFGLGRFMAIAAFSSWGMIMFFQAFLQFINFGGGYPSDQPFEEVYVASKAELARLNNLIPEDVSQMTRKDWDDYHRCKLHNVCVRRFARSNYSSVPNSNYTVPYQPSAPYQPSYPTNNMTDSGSMLGCFTTNGVTECRSATR